MRQWRKRVEVGHDGIRYTVYDSDLYFITDDEVRPPLVPEDEWDYEKWILYKRLGAGREEVVGRFPTSRAAKAAVPEGAG